MERLMPKPNDLSRTLATFDQDSTLIAVIEMSQSSWLVAGTVPGIECQPLKKLEPDKRRCSDSTAGGRRQSRPDRTISRIAVALGAGRDGFWLARWLHAQHRGHVSIRPASPCRVSIAGRRRSTPGCSSAP